MADRSTTFKVVFDADTGKLTVETQKAAGALEQVERGAGRASGPLGDIGKIAAGFVVGQGLMRLPGLLGGTVDSASDLAEAGSKVQVVFGPQAVEVEQFAKLADNIGLSDRAALEATGTFGNLFVSMGLSQEQAAGMSMDIVELAADLASFNNIEIADALDKLRAGLVGETEPLRALGVNLSAAAVESRALEMGLAATKEELDASDKAVAAYNLILEQTATAQGDFERTSDGLANKQRMLAADIDDLQAKFGQKLIPVMQEGVQVAGSLVEAADQIPFSTVAVAGFGAAVLVAAPKVLELGQNVGKAVEEFRKGDRPINTFGTRLAGLTAGLIAADLASQAFTGRSLSERVFGDVAKSEAAEDALSALDAKLQAFGPNADRAAVAFDLLGDANAKLQEGFGQSELDMWHSWGQVFQGNRSAADAFLDTLGGADRRIFGLNIGISGSVDNLKDLQAIAELAGAEMKAQGVPLDELIVKYQELNPELRDAFDAGSNVTAAWVEATGGLTGLANVLPEVRAAFDELKPSTEGVGEATANNLDPLTKWGDQVADNKDGTKDWDGALKDLLTTLTDADPKYLGLQANMALVKDEIAELKLKGDDLTQAEKDRLAVLEGTLKNLELAKGAYDANNEALDKLTGSVKTYVGDDVAYALIRSMQDTGQPADEMVEKFAGIQSVYDHLESNDIPGAMAAFEDLQGKLTEEEWGTGAKAVGEDIIDGIEKGVTDPVERQKLLDEVKTTVGIATGPDAQTLASQEGAEVGAAIAQGAAKGVEDNQGVINAALQGAVNKAIAFAKSTQVLDVNSPSKLFAKEVGVPISEGVAMGITEGADEYVYPAIEAMAQTAANMGAAAASQGATPYGHFSFDPNLPFGVTPEEAEAWRLAANGGVNPDNMVIHGQAALGKTPFMGQDILEGTYDPSANGGRGAWFYGGAWHMSPPDAGYGVEGNGFGKGSGIINGDDYPIPFGEMLNGEPAIDMNQLRAHYEAMGITLTDEELAERARGMLDQDYMSLAFGASDYVGGSYLDYHLNKQLLGYDIMGGGLSKYAKGGTAARGAAVPHGSNRGGGGSSIVVVINVQGSIVGPEQFITDVVKRKFSRLLG